MLRKSCWVWCMRVMITALVVAASHTTAAGAHSLPSPSTLSSPSSPPLSSRSGDQSKPGFPSLGTSSSQPKYSDVKTPKKEVGNQARLNVVEENPTLDVGPLVVVRVALGSTARLPCDTRPLYANDSVTLVLWYSDDTSRPFLSFDGRSDFAGKELRSKSDTSFKDDSNSSSRNPYKNTSYDLPGSNHHRNSVNNKRPDPEMKLNGLSRKKRSVRSWFSEVRTPEASIYKRRRLKENGRVLAYSYNRFVDLARLHNGDRMKTPQLILVEKPSGGIFHFKTRDIYYVYNNVRYQHENKYDFEVTKEINLNRSHREEYYFNVNNIEGIYENKTKLKNNEYKYFGVRRTRRSVTSSRLIPLRKMYRRKRELIDEPVLSAHSSSSHPLPQAASRQHIFLPLDGSSPNSQSTPAPPPYSSYLPYASVRGLGAPPSRVSRVTLARSGASLLIRDVEKKDQAEYRCTVHYRKSPSVTHRLRLEVQKRIRGMLLLDESGMVAGRETGPHSEGHRLTVTCRAAFEGELRSLEWMMDGQLLPSSWSLPRPKEVVSHLELRLVPDYDQKLLTCRVVTHAVEDEDGVEMGRKEGPEGPGTREDNDEGDEVGVVTADSVDGGGGNDSSGNEVLIWNNISDDENNVLEDRLSENDKFAGVFEVPKLVKDKNGDSEQSNKVRFVTSYGDKFKRSVADLNAIRIGTSRILEVPETKSESTNSLGTLEYLRRLWKQGTETIKVSKLFNSNIEESFHGRGYDAHINHRSISNFQRSSRMRNFSMDKFKKQFKSNQISNSKGSAQIDRIDAIQTRPSRRQTDHYAKYSTFPNSSVKRLRNFHSHTHTSAGFKMGHYQSRRIRRADTPSQIQENNFRSSQEETLGSNGIDTLSNYRDISRKSEEFPSSPDGGSSPAAGPKFRKHRLKASMKWEATITDISVRISMFSIPQSRLGVVEGEGVVGLQGGVSVEVAEGGQVTLECRVAGNPPPYNITFMLNGQVVSSPRLDQHLNYDGGEFFEEKSSRRDQLIKSEHTNKMHKSHAPKWIELSKNYRKNKYSTSEVLPPSSKDKEDSTERYWRSSDHEDNESVPLYKKRLISFIKSAQETLETIPQNDHWKTQRENVLFSGTDEIQKSKKDREIRRVLDYGEGKYKMVEEGRRREGGASLLVTPVVRAAEGLYTCLASNTEGDGHSNAIMLRVRHAPYCQTPPHRRLIVSRNSSITLFCPVEANPKVTSYTWIKVVSGTSVEDPRPQYEFLGRSLGSGPSLRVTPNMFQAFENEGSQEESVTEPLGWRDDSWGLDSGPSQRSQRRRREMGFQLFGHRKKRMCSPGRNNVKFKSEELDNFLEHEKQWYGRVQSKVRRSVISDAVGIVCYAKNSQGYSVRPCLFSMQLVDPPLPPANCSVTVLSSTRLAVHCLEPSPLPSTLIPTPQPGLGYVRSPHTRTLTTLEVWSSKGLLLINVSSVHPSFDVRGLPPASPLQLRLYASSPERLISTPVKLLASTPKWTVKESVIEEPPAVPEHVGVLPKSPSPVPQDHLENSQTSASKPQKPKSPQSYVPDTSTADESGSSVGMARLAALLCATALGGCVLVSVIVTLLSIIMKSRNRRRRGPSNLGQISPSSSRTGNDLLGGDRRRRIGVNQKYMRNENAVMMMSMEDDNADEERTPDDDRFDDRECGTTLSDDEFENGDRNSEEQYLDMNRSEQEQPLFSEVPLSDRGSNQDLLRTPILSFNSSHAARNENVYDSGGGMCTVAIGGTSVRRGNPSLEIVCKDDILRVVDNTFADVERFYCKQETQNQADVFCDVENEGYRRSSDQWSFSPSTAAPLHKMVTFQVPSDDVTSHENSDDPQETRVML